MAVADKKKQAIRTLTVENFSVIKYAKLEFGKITVLIGPQSSGKSLLCKLAYFFQKIVPEQIENAMRAADPWPGAEFRVQRQFLDWFGYFGNAAGPLEVKYSDGDYSIAIGKDAEDLSGTGSLKIDFSGKTRASYDSILREFDSEMQFSGTFADYRPYTRAIHDALLGLSESKAGEVYSYVPATRSFFVSPQKAILGLTNRNDEITLRFSQDLDFDFERRSPRPGRGHELTMWVDEASQQILRGRIVVEGNSIIFNANDGRLLPSSILSSGTQELLPLVTSLRQFVSDSAGVAVLLSLKNAAHKRLFFIEEPEASVFPKTQYDLVRIFTRMVNEPVLDASFVITTHSPYILSCFNNLLEAWQVGHFDDERGKAVNEVIDRKYWVNPDEFKAYAIEDGFLKSIVAEDTRLIRSNYLDSVSEIIGAEFDQLLRLGYVDA